MSTFKDAPARSLLQSDNQKEHDRTSDLVGLSVLIAVCLLFLLNICLCIYKLLAGDEEQRETVRRASPAGRTQQRNAPIPVIFVNPGGSVRIGQKLKRSNSEPMDLHGESSTPVGTATDAYPLREVDIDELTGSPEVPNRSLILEERGISHSPDNI